jgi:cytochrome c biogenesis protein CcmG/thiol:disulfide interchange protein DsbE
MRYVLPAVVFAILVGFFWVGLKLNPSEVPSPLIGKPAPAFELPELTDTSAVVSNETLKGRPALLNVWATWCAGCRVEHDLLLQIARQGDVPVYGLNYRDERNLALNWLEQLGNPYTAVAYDPDGTVSIDWGVYGAPETFLIDPDGIVVYKHIAPLTVKDWNEEFLPRIRAMRGGGK